MENTARRATSADSTRTSSWKALFGRIGGLLFEPKPSAQKPVADPAEIFEAALAEKHGHYETLKQAAASLLYLRNKLEGDLRERRADIARLHDELRNAVRGQDEPLALELITQKHELHDELAAIERELDEVRTEAREAKDELTKRHAEVRAMEREKLRIMTTLRSARARADVEAALGRAGPGDEATVQDALDRVREQAARIAMERSLDRELSGGHAPASAHGERAYAELRALREQLAPRRPALALAASTEAVLPDAPSEADSMRSGG